MFKTFKEWMDNWLELEYGFMGYGTVDYFDDSGYKFYIKADEWAPGIWAGSEGMVIMYVDEDGENLGYATVSAVDLENRAISTLGRPNRPVKGPISIWPKVDSRAK